MEPLSEVKYRSITSVKYRVYPDHIVFASHPDPMSGRNARNDAEDVIAAIAKKENLDPSKFTFYEFEPKRGQVNAKKRDYALYKLEPIKFDGRIARYLARAASCRIEIVEDFSEFLYCGEPIQARNLPESRGEVLEAVA